MFISADTPAADKLCAHYSNFSGNIQRPTAACDIPFASLDNPSHKCNLVKWEDLNDVMLNGSDQDRCSVSQHKCCNAFASLQIGPPMHKIFGALPTDPMHSVRKSLIGHSMEILFKCMTDSEKNKLDLLAKRFHASHRQTAQRHFPQTDFSNGVTKLSLMTADEICGSLYLLVCLAQFPEGWKLLEDAVLSKGGGIFQQGTRLNMSLSSFNQDPSTLHRRLWLETCHLSQHNPHSE
jgi:hypothetical protein